MGFLEGDVRIINLALTKLGEKTITARTETSEAAITMNLLYDHVRDEEIMLHPWVFSRARATLTRDSSDPSFEWTYQYLLPSDFLIATEIYNPVISGEFVIEGNKLLCGEETVYLKYRKRVTDTTLFDPWFVKALYIKLAEVAAPRLTGLRGRKVDLHEEYKEAIGGAMRLNAIGTNPPEAVGSRITDYDWVKRG